MYDFKVGDIVARKSYGGDIYFRIADITEKSGGKPIYILKGLFYRIEADSNGEDLVKQDTGAVYRIIEKDIYAARNNMYRNTPTMSRTRIFPFFRLNATPGRILHIDADENFMNKCLRHYREYRIPAVGKLAKESEQPGVVRKYLETYRPNVLVLTGHDSFKKNSDKNNIGSYRNSRHFIESARIARKYEPNPDRLCVFSGACQSYYELIMNAGANFASSPGRILINALDPAFVAQKISLTDSRTTVTPNKIVSLIISGSKGIWGIDTKGQFKAR